MTSFAFGSKPSSADCPGTAATPPVSSTETENSANAAFLAALDVAFSSELKRNEDGFS